MFARLDVLFSRPITEYFLFPEGHSKAGELRINELSALLLTLLITQSILFFVARRKADNSHIQKR